jgi:hypothetical protein
MYQNPVVMNQNAVGMNPNAVGMNQIGRNWRKPESFSYEKECCLH